VVSRWACRMIVWTSASVSRVSPAILVAAVWLASCRVWLVPSLSLARCSAEILPCANAVLSSVQPVRS
jgi:hypothetical protein